MKCDYCGSIFQKLPEEGVCPNCGGIFPTAEERKAKLKFPDPPLGIYKDAAGYLEVGPESVTFYRKQFIKAYKRTIPYDQIVTVGFQPGKPWDSGHLCVREWQARNVPVLTDPSKIWDKTTVYFRESYNEDFRKVYLFLKQCAEMVNNTLDDTVYVPISEVLGKYTGSYGFMELRQDGILFYKTVLKSCPTERWIPYSEIAEVAYFETKGNWGGGLSVRGQNDAKDLADALHDALTDDTSIDFTESSNDQMRKVYSFLVDQIKENSI